MRSVVFKVKIPVPERPGEYKEYEFTKPDDVSNLLNIPTPTMYAIIQGKIKFSHESIRHLANIKIERFPVEGKKKRKKKKTQEEIDEDRRIFERQLLERLDRPPPSEQSQVLNGGQVLPI